MTDKSYLPEGGLFGTPQNTEYISSREMLERAMREGMVAKTTTPNLQEMIALLEDKKGEVQARLHAVLGDRAPEE